MPAIRVLDSATRPMQRLGFLKHIARRVVTTGTSSLENLGTDLTGTVTRKVRVPLTPQRVGYIRRRLYDRAYDALKKEARRWREGLHIDVAMELQDLYLADSSLPSQTGKLVRDDWSKYPPLAIALGLIRGGTYSPNTRALSLLHFTQDDERQAFLEYHPHTNPFRISREQGLLLLYSSLERDGAIAIPLLCQLAREAQDGFTEREAGDRLPEIYRSAVKRHRGRAVPVEDRRRLEVLTQVAHTVEQWQGRPYTGGGARENAIRVRLEPYTDLGLLGKPDAFRYAYGFTRIGLAWTRALTGVEGNGRVGEFLRNRFFETAAKAWTVPAMPIGDRDAIVRQSYRAWQAIRSVGGYAPIEEIALVAGIQALCQDGLILEPAAVREAIISYQKDHPYEVRFTVNRMGALAHARFLEDPA